MLSAAPIVTAVLEGSGPIVVHSGDKLTSSVPSLSVVFSDNLNAVPGGANSVTNSSNWQLTRYGADVSDQISGITFGLDTNTNHYVAVVSFAHPLSEGAYQLVARQNIQNLLGQALDGDADGVAGGDFRRFFGVTTTVSAGFETRVNTVTGGNQILPAIAMDANGDYVAVWTSYLEDGSGYGVYAQRYAADGSTRGTEFRVNTFTTGYQGLPSVAMDVAGDFVVTWQSFGQDGSGMGIYAQRYSADGVTQGGEFKVNTFTLENQESPSVAMDAAGDFVIVWWNRSSSTSHYGSYAQRYNAAGIAQGAESKVNTPIASDYPRGGDEPKVAMDAAGDFVVIWTEQPLVGNGMFNEHAQRYNASGVAQGSPILVSERGFGYQVAMDALGDFVVTWVDTGDVNDLNGRDSIFAQRYNAAGISQGAFRVSNVSTYENISPSVAMDATGDLVIAWHQLGAGYNLYGKRYSSAGTALAPEFRVNSVYAGFNGISSRPVVAMDSVGDFVVAWTVASQDGSGDGIYLQHYRADVAPLLSQIETSPLTESAPLTVLVTSSLQVFDFDSNNWTGVSIRISNNYQFNQDELGFVNTNTPNISAFWNEGTGTLTLFGTDSVSNYRTALHNVTYRNISDLPNTALKRTISFQATDGLLASNVVSRDLTVTPRPVLPVLSGVDPTGTYVEKAAPLPIAPNLVAIDPNSVNFAIATVSFTNWQGEDRLSFTNPFALQTTFTQDLVTHTASLTIAGNDTLDHYQTLLRSIKYWDVSANPNTTPRIASIAASDGVFSSKVVSVNIAVIAVNDPPALSGIPANPLVYHRGHAGAPVAPGLSIADPDSISMTGATIQVTGNYQKGQDMLSFTANFGVSASFDANSGTLTLTGTTTLANYQALLRSVTYKTKTAAANNVPRTISFAVNDGQALSNPVTRNVTLT